MTPRDPTTFVVKSFHGRQVMFLKQCLTGFVGFLVSIFEYDPYPMGLLFVPDLGNHSTKHPGFGEQFDDLR